jgi:hypothetical protein
MTKILSLPTGSNFNNSLGDKAFIGSRIEGADRVTTLKIDVPYTNSKTGKISYFKETRKFAIETDSMPADYASAQERANAYFVQEIPDAAARATMSAGTIDLTIEDIALV